MKKQATISETTLLGRNGLIAQTRSYVTRERKKIMKQKSKRPKKVYQTNFDTISLNCEQFSGRAPFFPGLEPWEKPFNPRKALSETEQGLKNESRRAARRFKRKLKKRR